MSKPMSDAEFRVAMDDVIEHLIEEQERVEDIVDSFPIAEFAEVMKLAPDGLRAAIHRAVIKAQVEGGSIDNMRKVMEIAIKARKK
jgi:hypothetical protein